MSSALCETYELGMSVDPAHGHDVVADLSFKKLNLSVVSHGALVLFTCLRRHDQRVDQVGAVPFDSCEYCASFDLVQCVSV